MGTAAARKKRKRRSRVSRENRVAMLAITFVVCLLFAVLTAEGVRLNRRIDTNEARRQELLGEIAAEELRTEEILKLRASMQTDDFVRQAAKERLGLVEDNELIFRRTDDAAGVTAAPAGSQAGGDTAAPAGSQAGGDTAAPAGSQAGGDTAAPAGSLAGGDTAAPAGSQAGENAAAEAGGQTDDAAGSGTNDTAGGQTD